MTDALDSRLRGNDEGDGNDEGCWQDQLGGALSA